MIHHRSLACWTRRSSFNRWCDTATVIYGVTRPPYDEVRFSVAGHWPPVVGNPNGHAASASTPHELPLGVDPGSVRTTCHANLEPGDVLCLFTDGLLELDHRQEPEESLAALVDAIAKLDPAESADLNSLRLLASLVGTRTNQDDIAVLLIRRELTSSQQRS